MRIEKIEYYIKYSKAAYDFFCDAKSLYEECQNREFGDYPEAAYVAYIKAGTTDDAAKLLNEAGLRFGRRKYTSKDISDAIHLQNISDQRLMRTARILIDKATLYKDRLINVKFRSHQGGL